MRFSRIRVERAWVTGMIYDYGNESLIVFMANEHAVNSVILTLTIIYWRIVDFTFGGRFNNLEYFVKQGDSVCLWR